MDRSLFAILLGLVGCASAQYAVRWGHFGGAVQRSQGVVGFVGQAVQGTTNAPQGPGWQAGFLVHGQLLNHAPLTSLPLLDRQLPSGFGEAKFPVAGAFFDEDADPLVYRIQCPPELRCALSGDTIKVSATTGGSGASAVLVVATDPEGATAIDSFDIFQNKTVLPQGWDSTRTYGDPDMDFSGADYSGWWIGTRDSSIARLDSGRVKWLGPGTVDLLISAPGADTVRGTVVVKSRLLLVKASDRTKNQGNPDPELGYTVAGLVGSDSLGGRLTRDPGEAVGTYAIRQGSLTAGPKYELRFTNGIFTIRATSGLVKRVGPKRTAPDLRAVVAKSIGRISPEVQRGVLGTRLPECEDDGGCVAVEIYSDVSTSVSVSIFDHLGTHVIGWRDRILSGPSDGSGSDQEGRRRIPLQWNLHTSDGHPVAPGVYLWKIELETADGRVLKTVLKTGGK